MFTCMPPSTTDGCHDYLLPQFLYLVDDLSGYPLVHHLLGRGDIEKDEEISVCMGVVLTREGGVHRIRDLRGRGYNDRVKSGRFLANFEAP